MALAVTASRARIAELMSGVGALVLGVGTGSYLPLFGRSAAMVVIVLGAVLHSVVRKVTKRCVFSRIARVCSAFTRGSLRYDSHVGKSTGTPSRRSFGGPCPQRVVSFSALSARQPHAH